MALFLTQNLFVASGIDYWIYHAAADTLGHLLALKVTPANEQDRAKMADLSKAVQEATGQSVQVAFVDQGKSLAEAKTAMEAVPGCQDVIVTATGASTAPIVGWVSNVDIARASQA